MLLLRLLQKLVRALNSDGSPDQVAAGLALGAVFGLTPLFNLHNILILGAVALFNVSFPAAMLGWIVFVPVGFLLDPLFDAIGEMLLANGPFLPTWTAMYNAPIIPLSNYNNTVVLGSVIGWLILALPVFLAARVGVARYRDHVLPRLERLEFVKAVKASRIYTVLSWFRTD